MSWRLLVLCSLFLLPPASGLADRSPLRARKPGTDQFGDPLPEAAIARLGSIRFKHDTLDVRSVAFSPDSKLIASGGSDQTVRVWETSTGKPVAVLRGHEFEIRRDESFDLKDGKLVKTVSERKRLRWSAGAVNGLDFSADGKLLASCDRTRLIVWEVGTWRQRVMVDGEFHRIRPPFQLRITPDNNAVILSGGSDLYRFAVKDGKLEAKVRFPHIKGFDLDPDGKRIVAAAGARDKLRIYNAADLSLITSRSRVGDIGITRRLSDKVAVSPDRRWIAGAGSLGVLVSDANTQKVVRLIRNVTRVRDLKFSPDGNLLATAGLRLRLWRVGDWTEVGSDELLTPILQATFRNGRVNVGGALYDLHGKLLKSVDRRRMNLAVATDLEGLTPTSARTAVFEGPKGCLLIREWSPWGHWVGVRDFKTGRELFRHETRKAIDPTKDWEKFWKQEVYDSSLPISGIHRTILSKNGKRILILYKQSNPGYAVYRIPEGDLLRRVSIPEENGVGRNIETAAISRNGKLVAAVSREHPVIYLWNFAYGQKFVLGQLLHRLKWVKGDTGDYPQLIFSPDGRYLTATMEGPPPPDRSDPKRLPRVRRTQRENKPPALYVWDTRTGKVAHKFSDCFSMGRYNRPLFSPDGKFLASYHHTGGWYVARLHALPSGKQVAEIKLDPSFDFVVPFAFSRDGDLFACGRKYMLVCDTRTGKVLPTPDLESSRHVNFRFSPDGRFVASGAYDGHIRIWNVKTGKKVFEQRPNRHRVDAVVFTPDGNRLISIHRNRTALVWEVPRLDQSPKD